MELSALASTHFESGNSDEALRYTKELINTLELIKPNINENNIEQLMLLKKNK